MKLSTFFAAAAVIGSSLFVANPAHSKFSINAFGTCRSEDGVYVNNGNWYFYENLGRMPGRVVKGGTYTITQERILNSDYGSKKGYTFANAYRLRRNDGVLVKKLYLPIDLASSVCQ